MSGKQEVMWPRLVANKLLRKTLGSNNFVADFPDNSHESNVGYDDQMIKYKRPKDIHKYKIFASTWNVGGVAPPDDIDMEVWLDTHNNPCDIYVLGFQEVVPLRASNVLGADRNKISMKWNSLIRESLNKKSVSENEWKENQENLPEGYENYFHENQFSQQEFQCVISKQMVGVLISVWVRLRLRPYISHTSVSCVGCGIMGCLGNKGSVAVRFLLHETSFCFICNHLASGGREGDQVNRNSNVAEIFSRTSFPRGPLLTLPKRIMDHDVVILLGDLNYRINLPESTTRRLADKQDWNTLLENDQLSMELAEGQVFEGWHEGVINFAPTYKFYVNSDVYYGCSEGKRGEKKRAPAWCDRIIWWGKLLKQLLYTSGESRLSDHRPVKAVFTTELTTIPLQNRLQNSPFSERPVIGNY